MIIGIISGAKDKKIGFFERVFARIKVDCMPAENPFELVAALLPYSEAKLKKMSSKKLERLTLRAKKKLEHHGADNVIFTKEIKKLCIEKNIILQQNTGEIKELFFQAVPIGLRKAAKECKIDLLKAFVCISDSKMDTISEYLARMLCYDIKNLTIATKNTEKAKAFCNDFFEDTGLSVSVCDMPCRYFDVLIDIDGGFLQIGQDLFVAEFDFGFDFCGFSVSSIDAAVHLIRPDINNINCVYLYR